MGYVVDIVYCTKCAAQRGILTRCAGGIAYECPFYRHSIDDAVSEDVALKLVALYRELHGGPKKPDISDIFPEYDPEIVKMYKKAIGGQG